MTKSALPNTNSIGSSNLTNEYYEYDYLYNLVPRTTSGDISFTSSSSNLVYSTATYSSGKYANQGQSGMLLILGEILINYLIGATDFNNKVEQADFNAHLADTAAHGDVMRQTIINGNFAINQRVVSGTVTLASGQYGHDRWKAGISGCTYTFSTVENVTTITITAGSLQQIIEGINLFTGNYTLSWVGTTQGKIGAGSYGASGITGSVTGGTNLTIEFGIGTLSKVQFNFGTTALPFFSRSFAEELVLCQRYYEKSYEYGTAPYANTQINARITNAHIAIAGNTAGFLYYSTHFLVQKRVAPTFKYISSDGIADAIYVIGVGTRTGVSGNLAGSGAMGYMSISNISSANISLNAGLIYQWIADAEL